MMPDLKHGIWLSWTLKRTFAGLSSRLSWEEHIRGEVRLGKAMQSSSNLQRSLRKSSVAHARHFQDELKMDVHQHEGRS